MTHPAAVLRAEVAYVSHHLHWGCADVLSLPHGERVAWVRQVAALLGEDARPGREP
ncbi:DUF6760 family protein [Streptomyces palmae]|uniref:DUF6760 family protein n=1 Tax=Streptomyces palmae TaxID=1701085 RepID=UPI0014328582|nr:DUF6760 family protein [Streptomyces palmae]